MQRVERAAICYSSIFHMWSIHNIHTRLTCQVALAEWVVTEARLAGAKSVRDKNTLLFFLLDVSSSFLYHSWFGHGSIPMLPAARRPFHWAFSDALWIIHSDLIDQRVGLQDRLISGLVKVKKKERRESSWPTLRATYRVEKVEQQWWSSTFLLGSVNVKGGIFCLPRAKTKTKKPILTVMEASD